MNSRLKFENATEPASGQVVPKPKRKRGGKFLHEAARPRPSERLMRDDGFLPDEILDEPPLSAVTAEAGEAQAEIAEVSAPAAEATRGATTARQTICRSA